MAPVPRAGALPSKHHPTLSWRGAGPGALPIHQGLWRRTLIGAVVTWPHKTGSSEAPRPQAYCPPLQPPLSGDPVVKKIYVKIRPALPAKESRRQVGCGLSPGITCWEVLRHLRQRGSLVSDSPTSSTSYDDTSVQSEPESLHRHQPISVGVSVPQGSTQECPVPVSFTCAAGTPLIFHLSAS